MNDTHQDVLFDLGNTRLKYAVLNEEGGVGDVVALADQSVWEGALPTGRVAYLSSVASDELSVRLIDRLCARFQRISIARTQAVFAGVRIAYARPERLGVDRFLALLAAHGRGRGACLVVGVGTALTIDLLDAAGCHVGGRIAPSPELMRAILQQRIGQLPASGGDYVEFADDTGDALVSGCEGAALALIERSLRQARDRLGDTPTVLLHGGGADALRMHLPDAQLAPALVLEGLASWARAGQVGS